RCCWTRSNTPRAASSTRTWTSRVGRSAGCRTTRRPCPVCIRSTRSRPAGRASRSKRRSDPHAAHRHRLPDRAGDGAGGGAGAAAEPVGGVAAIGRSLFGALLLPFELTAPLLLVAIVGAVAIWRRQGGEQHL